jgi:hypothetical protein
MFAHHSVSGVFDDTKNVELKGAISKIEWVNPHVYIYIDVKEGGGVTTWALESYPTRWFSKAGLGRKSFPIGEAVTVTAFVARDKTKNLAFARKMTFADGHILQFFTNDAVIR